VIFDFDSCKPRRPLKTKLGSFKNSIGAFKKRKEKETHGSFTIALFKYYELTKHI